MNIFAFIKYFVDLYFILHLLLVIYYAFEYYYIEYLNAYWDVMPDDIFMEEIISILTKYNKNICDYKNDKFIRESLLLYRNNVKLRIELYKYGLKDRFINHFTIETNK